MEANRSFRRTGGIQIDLTDWMGRLHLRWKQMIACALVFAVFAGGYSYLADTGSSEKSGEAEELTTVDDADPALPVTDTVPEKTEEEQAREVADAVYLVQEIERLEEYLSQSILMQTDPYHKNRVVMLYSIEHAAERQIQKIAESYLSYLADGGAVDTLQRASREWKGMKGSYLAEMASVSQKASGTASETLLSVEVTGKDAAMAQRLAADLQDAVKDYSQTVRDTCGSHTLSLLSLKAGERVDTGLLTQQREKHSQLTANQAGLKTLLNGFDEEQKAMYQTAVAAGTLTSKDDMTDIKTGTQDAEGAKTEPKESDNDSASEFAGGQPENSDPASESAGGQLEDSNPASISADGQPEEGNLANTDIKPARSIKILHVLLGFLGGIFTYSLLYTFRYVAQGTVKSAREFRLYYTIPYYGCISAAQIQEKESVLFNRICLACRKHHTSEILLAAVFAVSQDEKNGLQELACQLQERGIHAVITENADTDPSLSLWETLSKDPFVLLLCGRDRTTYHSVDEAMEFYLENHVQVFGAAVWE